ncbi:MAG: endonuclease III [Ignavibacteriales bacterium]|nr:endonuclease III [Ignavibacteriota bacterium]MCB9249184.1 endonuclease III [Ignavibacteriales bacterium]
MKTKKELTRINQIFTLLKNEYPNTKPQLEYSNPLQLLIATILSAQCTDARVNIVTKDLFKKYISAEDFANANILELEKLIFSTGFYKQKAKSIKGCCSQLIEKYNGKVPQDFELLTKLPGVGRKTASVVAGHAFNIPAIAVDTHVNRITNLLGIVDSKNPDKIETELKELLPEEDWVNSTHWFINHGRNVCIARRPKCEICIVEKYCPSSKLKPEKENGKK